VDLLFLEVREVFEEAAQPLRKVRRYPVIVPNRVREAGCRVASADGLINVKDVAQVCPRVWIANELSGIAIKRNGPVAGR
jgi:hypothetical protein